MPRFRAVTLLLAELVRDFAVGIQAVDSLAPIASSSRTGVSYQPGIGPHTEAQTIKLVMAHLADTDPERYGSYRLGVSYADGTRQACDLCLGSPGTWEWAAEVKMLRLMGDNGKLNDNMVMHILSPYPAHRSALTDCTKLLASQLGTQRGADLRLRLPRLADGPGHRGVPGACQPTSNADGPTGGVLRWAHPSGAPPRPGLWMAGSAAR